MVNAGTRIKMGSIKPENLSTLDVTAIRSQASSNSKRDSQVNVDRNSNPIGETS